MLSQDKGILPLLLVPGGQNRYVYIQYTTVSNISAFSSCNQMEEIPPLHCSFISCWKNIELMTEQAAMYMKLALAIAYADSNVDGSVEGASIKQSC